MRAFVFEAWRALSDDSRQAVSVQSGKTSDATMNHVPSGDHEKPFTSVGNVVAWTGSPPERSSTQICDDPPRLERKASRRPSGEKRGSESRFSPEVIRRGSPEPSKLTIQIAERDALASTSGVDTAYATRRPSGETEKPPTRRILADSSKRSGFGAAMSAGAHAS